mmetsp:Transcript_1702/g.5314  ORF Transcript_1702/g.5314 Transcript_1702/m.5314 type:complete len:330 (-) Transcript_1702:103-1092(-)
MQSRHLLAALLLQALALEAVLLQPDEESQAARSSGNLKSASWWDRLRRIQRRAPQEAVRPVPQETQLAEETQLVEETSVQEENQKTGLAHLSEQTAAQDDKQKTELETGLAHFAEETAAQDEKQKTELETKDTSKGAHTVMTEQRRAELKARWQARLKREAHEKVLAAKADKMEADRVRVRRQAQLRSEKAEHLRRYEKTQAERRKAEAVEKVAREKREAAKEQVQLKLAKAKAPATLRKVQPEAQAVEEAPRSGSIRLNVIDSEDRGVQITVPKTARTQVLTSAALKRFGLDGSGARFLHDGVELEASQPLEKYGLDDLDTVDVEMPY